MRLGPRMTTRRWMIVVAVTGFAIEGARTGDRWLAYRRIADHHAQLAEAGMKMVEGLPSAAEILTPQDIAHHAAMARKYRQAARYPWFPIAADPPASD